MPPSSYSASLRQHPIAARAVPFVIFAGLSFVQGQVPDPGQYWIYLLKTFIAGWVLWIARPALTELQWTLSWEAIAVGVGVFVIWVGLDPFLRQIGWADSYPKMRVPGASWNPTASFGSASLAGWCFIVVRIAGSTLLVPMLEEVFFRSFLYRYIERADFLSVALSRFSLRAFLVTSILFAVEHREWLAGLLTGVAYQGLVCRKGRLGDAITAHAITNLLLGIWVVWKGAWEYW